MNDVTILFHRFGPYHRARLRAAAQRLRITALELSAHDDTYAWAPLSGSDDFRRITLFDERDAIHEPMAEVVRRRNGAPPPNPPPHPRPPPLSPPARASPSAHLRRAPP